MTKSRGIRNPKGTRAAFVAANEGKHFCSCGCGGVIAVRAEHFHTGVPKYRLGHNPQAKKPKPNRLPCRCGCNELAPAGKRYLPTHHLRGRKHSAETRAAIAATKVGERNPMFGRVPANYKGRIVNADGYVLLHRPEHPFADAGHRLVMEHRLVAEAALRKSDPDHPGLVLVEGVLYLRREYEVHHANEVKDDNRIENLRVMTKAAHTRHHLNQRR